MVYMAPIPPSQSHRLHLLTVTADGRRVYWAAASSRYGSDRECMGMRQEHFWIADCCVAIVSRLLAGLRLSRPIH